MSVELRHLRAFVAVVDEGTFTDAAIAIGTTQASVSRAVLALEAELGTVVLRRTTRQVALTPAGGRILGPARRALGEVAAIEAAVRRAGSEVHIGYPWSALGRHTVAVQRAWHAEHPDEPLVFVHANTATAGLAEGIAEVAILRRLPPDKGLQHLEVGTEQRYAAMADGDPMSGLDAVRLGDFVGRTVGVDLLTGTTTPELWAGVAAPPPTFAPTRDIDEWLTLIASGRAVGVTAESTAWQYPRPGLVYRPILDAPRLPVWVIWWTDDPPVALPALLHLVQQTYAG